MKYSSVREGLFLGKMYGPQITWTNRWISGVAWVYLVPKLDWVYQWCHQLENQTIDWDNAGVPVVPPGECMQILWDCRAHAFVEENVTAEHADKHCVDRVRY